MSEQKNPNLQTRSPAQLAILSQAREKAKAVRAENAKLKQQERDLIKLEKERAKQDKAKDIEERYAKLKSSRVAPAPQEETEPELEPEPEPEPEPPTPVPKKKTKKPAKQKVVMVSDTDTSEEEEEQIVYVKKPKIKKPPKIVYREESPPAPPAPKYRYIQPEHEELYKKMFS